MKLPIYIYDPTAKDSMSKVRGIGRYLEMLRDYATEGITYTGDLKTIPFDSVFINPFFSFTQKPLVTKRIAKKQLTIIHDLIPQKHMHFFPIGIKGSLMAFYNRLTLNNYDGIIAVSENTKHDVQALLGLTGKSVHVLYSTITDELKSHILATDLEPLEEKPYCIYVGDATWNKNLINLAKAITQAKIPCIFIGKVFSKESLDTLLKTKNHWLNELKGFIKESENNDFIHLKGFVTNEELAAYYKNATANLLVSRDEGFGFSFLEAAYAGCPTVLADIPVFHEIAHEAALYANPEEPDDIAKQISNIQQQEIRNQIIKNQKAIITKYSPEQFVKNFYSILDQYREL
jgi:glycosyltransferase involved in cell wall biosynthesis